MTDAEVLRRHRRVDALTERQREIVRGLLHGYTPQEIATACDLSVRTVYWHMEGIYAAVPARSVGELAAWAQLHRDCCGAGALLPAPLPA